MLRPHFSLHWSYAGSPTQPLAMSRSVSASLVSRSRYHYLVNRQRRRANTCTVHHTGVSHLTVITNLSFLYFISLLLICASIFPFCNAVQIAAHQSLVDSSKPSASFLSSPSTSLTTQCIIGRLRQCYEDEDCVENASPQKPEVNVVISSHNGTEEVVHSATFVSKPLGSDNYERTGTCTCRHARRCKRTQQQQSPKIVPIGESGKLADQRANQSGHFGWLIGTLITLTLVGGCSFAIYYYGIRYGMIRNIARQLGLTDNTQIEHQLLNQIQSHTEEDAELTI